MKSFALVLFIAGALEVLIGRYVMKRQKRYKTECGLGNELSW